MNADERGFEKTGNSEYRWKCTHRIKAKQFLFQIRVNPRLSAAKSGSEEFTAGRMMQ